MTQFLTEKQRLLSDIQGVARKLKSQTAASSSSIPRPNVIAIPQLELAGDDVHEEILHSLQALQIPHYVEESLVAKSRDLVSQLRTSTSRTFNDLCQKLLAGPTVPGSALDSQFQSLRRTFQNRFLHSLLNIKASTVASAQQWADAHTAAHDSKRTPFNADFIPLLEKYFEFNAYPSGCDKLKLAKKSMMSPRQIEVWFQNHRRRSKKEGRPLRRLLSEQLPADLDLGGLASSIPHLVKPTFREITPLSDEDCAASPPPEHPSESPTPHQSPESAVGSNPLVNLKRADDDVSVPLYEPRTFEALAAAVFERNSFSPPPWMRSPRNPQQKPRSRFQFNLDAFVDEFHGKLNVRGPQERASPRRLKRTNSGTQILPLTMNLPTAPHPALIRTAPNIRTGHRSSSKRALYASLSRRPTRMPFASRTCSWNSSEWSQQHMLPSLPSPPASRRSSPSTKLRPTSQLAKCRLDETSITLNSTPPAVFENRWSAHCNPQGFLPFSFSVGISSFAF
ncbi:hypothetical protein FA15DRAFT_662960 [Coprinopsis marcescibilis]|uniref:Homeobox domain-containing protein n=1 Tax=Coprinopsis marcescibilis TaxID=230819 RepID=A0A5C3LCU7_COPMA|nr:hypothetical protein FA15DRAFT_662960 [Coprinopsis marcescibilis]